MPSPEVASVVSAEAGARGSDSQIGDAQAALAWPLPRGLEHLRLETSRATLAYWAGLVLLASALFVPKLLPCVDYPQHLALADVAHRLESPGAPEHATHILNYFTYNGLFHLLVAKLTNVMPIELAGRSVVALSMLLLGAGVVALLRVVRRPPSYAAFFTPLVFSFAAVWGFANYSLGIAVMVWAVVLVARCVIRPSIPHVLGIAAVGLLCAFAHVLGMLLLCLTAASIAPELAWRVSPGKRRVVRAALRVALALAPLLVGCWFCISVYKEQYHWDPNMYRDPTVEGTAPPLWQKVFMFTAFASNLYGDRTDHVLLVAMLALTVTTIVLAWRRKKQKGALTFDDSQPPLYGPFIALLAAYLATPMVLIGTHLIFPRLGQVVVLGAVLAVPSFGGAVGLKIRKAALAIGAAAGLNLFVHCAIFAHETNDASRVIDDLPPGRAATSVMWDPETFSFKNGTLTHLSAYYGARKHGQWAYAFARYLSVPVRFKGGTQPAWPKKGWEFQPWDYNPRCGYARFYDLVIVKEPGDLPGGADDERSLRKRVFKEDADAVKLVSHHGRYWAFDTAGLPNDGTP